MIVDASAWTERDGGDVAKHAVMKPPGNPYKKHIGDMRYLWRREGPAEDIYGIERFVLLALCAVLLVMPTMALRWLGGLYSLHGRKIVIEMYAITKPVALLIVLWTGLASHGVAALVTILFLVDLFSYLFGIMLLREFWSRPFAYSRTLILLAVNFIEFSAGFATLYMHLNVLRPTPIVWTDALYFSVVTAATVGYGDITPSPEGKWLVMIHIFLSLAFMAMIVSHFVSNLTQRRNPTGTTPS